MKIIVTVEIKRSTKRKAPVKPKQKPEPTTSKIIVNRIS